MLRSPVEAPEALASRRVAAAEAMQALGRLRAARACKHLNSPAVMGCTPRSLSECQLQGGGPDQEIVRAVVLLAQYLFYCRIASVVL